MLDVDVTFSILTYTGLFILFLIWLLDSQQLWGNIDSIDKILR